MSQEFPIDILQNFVGYIIADLHQLWSQLTVKDIKQYPEILYGFLIFLFALGYSIMTICVVFMKLRQNLKSQDPEMQKKGLNGKLFFTIQQHIREIYDTYANHKSNLGPILHLLLIGPGWITSYYHGKTRFIPCEMLSEIHLTSIPICGVIGWIVFFNALFSNPGKITKENVKEICEKYDYDNIMYIKDKMCKTCKIPKPARSKHCSLCDSCFEHQDHHCYWINKCVTRHNYLKFLLLPVTYMLICGYASYVFFAI